MKSKKSILIALTVLVALAVAYAAWYSYDRHEKLVGAEKCDDLLANPPQPTMVTGPDGNPAPLYSLNGCATVVVPPSLWDIVRGRMVFDNVPNRMKVNPYSLTDILLGRYTFGPTDIGCDQSATTTDCSQFNATSTQSIDRAALAQLQADMQGITPHFIAIRNDSRQIYTYADQKIKEDVIALFVAGEPDNSDFYSNLWLDAIGTRYILASQPIAESSYDEILDSQTGMITPIPESARWDLSPVGRNAVLYIDTQHIYLYTLDHPATTLVPNSTLSGTETYTSGEVDNPSISPRMSYTPNSITITIFDSSKRVPNPKLGVGATMNGAVREVTLSF